MPKYLIEASYTRDGVAGLRSKGGSSRRDAVAHAVEGLGGSLESFYFAFGERDAYVTVDLPDDESAAAVALTVNAAGGRHDDHARAAHRRAGRRRRQALGRLHAARRLSRGGQGP